MRHVRGQSMYRLMAVGTLAGLLLLGGPWDAEAIPVFRPRPPPRAYPVHEIPRIPEGVRTFPGAEIKRPTVERTAAEVRSQWEQVTHALGPETATASPEGNAYVVMHTGSDGQAWMATNLVRGTDTDRSFVGLSAADLQDPARLEQGLQRLLGPAELAATVTLKVLLEGSLADDATRTEAIKALTLATERFRFAELVEIGSGQAYALERVEREGAAPRWLGRLNTCCVYTGIPPDIANWNKLAGLPFERDRLQVVSLFPDYVAQQRLKRSGLNVVVSHPDEISGDPLQALAQVIAGGPPGAPVAVIGHVQGGDFVIEGGQGAALPLSTVSEMAARAGRPVFLLGCYTAEHYLLQPQTPPGPIGFPVSTLSLLHPRELVERLGAASRNAKSMQDFTALISSENLYVHLPANFMTTLPDKRRSVVARILSMTKDRARAVTGFFQADLPCLFGFCP